MAGRVDRWVGRLWTSLGRLPEGGRGQLPRRSLLRRTGLLLLLLVAAVAGASAGSDNGHRPARPRLADSSDATSSPVMDAGTVAGLSGAGALSHPNGVAVVAGGVFVADGTRVLRVDVASGAASVVAGSTASSCVDGASGSAVRFSSSSVAVQVVGSDGTSVYVVDSCGLRRVDLTSGATSTLTNTVYSNAVVVGQVLYGRSASTLYRRDLSSGATTSVVGWNAPLALAADSSYLWAYNGSTGALQRIDPATGQQVTVVSYLSLHGTPTAMLSVGGYLYLADVYQLGDGSYGRVARVSKTDGSLQQIAGVGASPASQWFNTVSGIGSDGTRLYVADYTATTGSVKTLTPAAAPAFPAAASAPVMAAGSVATLTAAGALSSANGVAVLGGSVYTAAGSQIVRVDPGSGAVTVVAGTAGSSSCQDASTGAGSRFVTNLSGGGVVRVVGADGAFVYVADNCGIRKVDPSSGATVTIDTRAYYRSIAIAGRYLYGAGIGNDHTLYRDDLAAGTSSVVTTSAPTSSYLAADGSYVWMMVGATTLYRIDVNTGQQTTINVTLPSNANPQTLLSVGDYLYVSQYDTSNPNTWPTLARVAKADGSSQQIPATAANSTSDWISNITGIATDGTRLYVADSSSAAGAWIRTVTAAAPRTIPSAPSAPVMQAGSVTTVTAPGALSTANGVAVVGATAYTADGTRIIRTDLASGAVSVAAGTAGTTSCQDASTGAASRFVTNLSGGGVVRVVGSDGTYVYVADNCGIRRVTPSSGATMTINYDYYSNVIVAGHNLYATSVYGRSLYRIDLTTGMQMLVTSSAPYNCCLAADDSYVWMLTGGILYRIDPATGQQTQIGSPPGAYWNPNALLSVGGYLYVTAMSSTSPTTNAIIGRISKTDATATLIAGTITGHNDGIQGDGLMGGITALTSDGTSLYVTESSTQAGAWLRRIRGVKLPTVNGGPSLWRETAGGSNPSEPGYCAVCHGDPVQTDTGALLEPATDLTTTGTGLPLAMTRTYSSEAATTKTPVGYGWAWPYGATITQPATQPGTLYLTQENGSVLTFAQQADGTFKAAPRVQAILTRNGDGTWTFVRMRSLTMTFDSTGRLIKQADPNAVTNQFSYDSTGHLTQVTDAAGRKLTFTYDSSGLLASATAPSGHKVTYGHSSAGDLTSVTDPAGAVTSYTYDSNHLLTRVTWPRGGTTTNSYDAARRIITQTDRTGGTWSFAYTDGLQPGDLTTTTTAPDGTVTVEVYVDGQIRSQTRAAGTPQAATTTWEYDPATSQQTKVTDPTGAVTTATYDANGNQLTATDPLGRTTNWTYDALGEQTSATNPAGQTSSATYDANGNRLTLTSPTGRVQRWTYNPDGTLATATTAAGRTTTYLYDTAGHPIRVTDPDGRTTATTYDPDGRITTMTDPAGHATSYGYDSAGRLTTITDPAGHATSYSYGTDGNRTAVTDPNGHSTNTTYDLADRATATTDPAGGTISYTYTPSGTAETGQVASSTDPNGHTVTYIYNRLGARTAVTDPAGHTTRYTYDLAGRLLTTTAPSGAVTTNTYDAAGQQATTVDPAGHTTTFTYTAAGLLASTTDPNGRVTRRSYTGDGDLATITNADTSTTSYSYNPDGQLVTFTDPDGHPTSYTYDPAGLLASRTQPGGLVTSYQYDAAGRLSTITQPDGSTATRSYDTAGHFTGITYSDPATPSISYSYDPAGRLTTMTDGTGTSHYSYDPAGRTTTSTNGAGTTISYTYDNAGRLTGLTYPGGNTVSYSYDNAGQMTGATDWSGNTTTFTWTVDGQQASQTTPNGVTTSYSYDPAGNNTAIAVAHSPDTLATYSYTYDAAGQLTADTATGNPDHGYTFTATGQLTTVTGTSPDGQTNGAFTTTAAGQLTGLPDGTTLTYNNAQQLTKTTLGNGQPATTFGYDANGNRTSATTATSPAASSSYRYNNSNQLLHATTPDGVTVDYTYDGNGLRQTRSQDGTTSHLLWNTAGSLPLLLDDGHNRYLYGPNLTPYAQVDDTTGTIHYLHADQLGSVRLITDTTGAVAATTSYDAYGNRTTHTGATDSPIGYTGNWTDPTTGLIYLRARDYDPTTGQFTTIDPAADTTHQPYTYAANNPLQNTDPTGLYCAPNHLIASRQCNPKGLDLSLSLADRIVLSGPSNWVAHQLEHGPVSYVATAIEGFGDGASFGLSSWIRDKLSPGSNCYVKHNAVYNVAGFAGMIATAIITHRLSAGAGVGDGAAITESGGWVLPEEGGRAVIGGRVYTEHALERMAPRTPQVMAELERRALARARAQGVQPGTKEFGQWWAKYGPDPRNIPPSVVESEIAHPGSTGVKVITNSNGAVVTVIPN